jgi:hypothetical protein
MQYCHGTSTRATMEKCSGLPAKQRKLNPLLREVESTSKSSRLDIVPVEILSEILHHVASPKDVLSVARCNKRLRATLLNPSNVMIWRRVRSNCVVPGLPPPPLDWSESAYAAFIFDSGICHVCRTHSYPFFQQDPKLLASCNGFPTDTGLEWVILPPVPSF